ncbi:MAG: ABC transporter substrate-binding protein [Flavobacteriales bacterium]|nr:ABC transporter substrate-binding protein [Flavobacteriales bacterium]MDW8410033.1 ABC transporter substrate-binding protein [Flavobacteriales bacterium]
MRRAAAWLMAAYLGACSPSEAPPGFLRYNEPEGIRSLDPVQAFKKAHIWATRLWAETLFEVDSIGRPIPHLCSGYRWSPDRCTLRLGIRKHIFFHPDPAFGPDSTRPLGASDVVFSLQRAAEHPASSWLFSAVRQNAEGSRWVRAEGDTVEIILRQPSAAFLLLLANPQVSIIPPEPLSYYGENWSRHPVGTGPFRFVAWYPEQLLIFLRNPRYWKKNQSYDSASIPQGVHIRFLRDRQAEIIQFLQGQLDFLVGNERAYSVFFLDPEGSLKQDLKIPVRLEKGPVLNTEYLGFNLEKDCLPCRSSSVRRFIAASIDRPHLVQYALEGLGIPADASLVPYSLRRHTVPFLSTTPPPKPFQLRLMTTAPYALQGALLKEMLGSKGVDLTLGLSDQATHKTAVANGEFEFFRASWIADYPDPENYYSLFYSAHRCPAGPNYSRFSHPLYDSLYVRLTTATTPLEKFTLMHRMDSILQNEMPVIPLYYDIQLRFLGPRVAYLPFDLSGNPDFSNALLKREILRK